MSKNKNQKTSEDEVVVNDDGVETTEESVETADGQEVESDSAGEDSEGNACDQLKADNTECQDKLLRLAAEFENYKKRMIRDKQTALKYAEENILKDLLPVLDNLERAMNQEGATSDVNTLLEGVDLTLKGLLATIKKYGLEPIESVGKPFDPNLHEALVMEASDEVPAQCVLREFEKGYYFKERLLRAAKVVVSKGQE
nr:nucleotide exchange factor GrpE [Desulfobulbaceae bacterium]